MAVTWGNPVTYGGGNFFQVGVEGSVSNTNTETTITAKTYIRLYNGYHEGFWNFQGRTNAGGGWSGWVSGGDTYIQDTNQRQISSTTYKKSRTTSAQTVTVQGQAKDTYLGTGTGSASQNVTVPALTSYTVSYNANSGSGAPSNQTKYYGISLTLSSTKPTRTNYNFKGWATSSANATAGTVSYQPGATYTGNAALTLYAVWELAYVAPTITSLKVFRSDSSGNADSESTTHVTFILAWSFDQTGGTNTSGTLDFAWSDSGGNRSATNIALSGQTGSITKTYAASSGKSYLDNKNYTVTATVKDAHNLKASKTASVPSVFTPIMARSKGHSVGILGTAPALTSTDIDNDVRKAWVFGEMNVSASEPTVGLYASKFTTMVGVDPVTANTNLVAYRDYDRLGYTAFYSATVKKPDDDLYRSIVLQRRNAADSGNYTGGLYIHVLPDGNAYVEFGGTNCVLNTKAQLNVGGYYALFTGKNIAKGGVIGTTTDVWKYRLYLVQFTSGTAYWCLAYRYGGSMGRAITSSGASTIYGVGAYDSGNGSYVFKTVIAVDANGKLTHTVSSQHLLATSGNTGTNLNIAAIYGIA